ncbi:hypothetical protein UB33_21795 [Photobacterium angustum]|uniref:hypothetical protein n=1 Tax=Photobacterium angustum TaxID=661 RepID=UPI0005E1AE8F|nr:hypothetical protein [Photobacterium angustum]KJG03867.1 hypothetical protein UB33_21795 [Photobacterium angustum]PSV95412.1 hypothetical protein CTN01_04250 [Photobacterium angustum]PSW78872.1 hypothetical protein CTN03_16930 [Photobacterium angustum]
METLNKEQQIERLYATAPVYEWELIVNPDSSRTKVAFVFFLIPMLIGLTVLFFNWNSDGLVIAGVFAFTALWGAPWIRYLIKADKRYYYAINQYGIYLTEEDIIPEIAYTIVRRSAWVGCAICIFAAIFIGPMAFVGAGGAALMSFSMTNFRPKPYKHQCLFGGYAKLRNSDENYYILRTDPLRTENSLVPLVIPKNKLIPIIKIIKQYNDTFEEEFSDIYKGSKFQAHRVILEVVR